MESAAAPLTALGGWLPELGADAAPARAAFAEWLSTTMPMLFPRDDAAELVERLTGDRSKEDPMAYTVLEEKLRRRLSDVSRESEARGIEQGIERGIERGLASERRLLRDLASRKFGDAAVARVAEVAAEAGDAAGLGRIGRWLMDCATDAELVARLDAVAPNG